MNLDTIQLWPMRELRRRPRPAHLVEGVLIKGSLALLVGRWGDGKTAIAVDLAYRIANGDPWCGRATLQGPVVYVAAEASDDVLLRSEAWERANPGRERDVLMLPREVNLFSPTSRFPSQNAAADETMERLYERLDGLREPPVLVIFDTYAQCTVGSHENDAGDVGIVMREVKKLMRRYGCAVLLLHHPPLDQTQQRARGSGALDGAADVSLWVKREKDGSVVTLDCKKSRRLSPFPPVELQLTVVELEDGTTSIVAEWRQSAGHQYETGDQKDDIATRKAQPRRKGEKHVATLVLTALRFGPALRKDLEAATAEAIPHGGSFKRAWQAAIKERRLLVEESETGRYSLRPDFQEALRVMVEGRISRTLKQDGRQLVTLRAEDFVGADTSQGGDAAA